MLQAGKNLESTPACNTDQWFTHQDLLNLEVRKLLATQGWLMEVSHIELAKLCAWVSKHRPVPPFRFLMDVSRELEMVLTGIDSHFKDSLKKS